MIRSCGLSQVPVWVHRYVVWCCNFSQIPWKNDGIHELYGRHWTKSGPILLKDCVLRHLHLHRFSLSTNYKTFKNSQNPSFLVSFFLLKPQAAVAELVGTMMLCVVGCGALIRGEGGRKTYILPSTNSQRFQRPWKWAKMPEEETERESVPTPSHVSGAIYVTFRWTNGLVLHSW